MYNLVIFGPPGSGKGTQSEKIIEKYNLKHLSTGDVLRNEICSGSELGDKIKALIEKGELVPDELVQEMVKAFVAKNKDAKGFIFDGFPRTSNQAIWLDNMLSEFGAKVDSMLFLDVADDELRTRLLNRGKDSGRKDDQDESIIENRIKVYKSTTLPVIEYYQKANVAHSIEGMGSIDEIFERITQAVAL